MKERFSVELMNPIKLARDYVNKAEGSRERTDRQDQVAAMAVCAVLGPVLMFGTVRLGGSEVLFAWLFVFVAGALAFFGWRACDRVGVTV